MRKNSVPFDCVSLLADSYELHPINTVIWKIIEASDSLTQHQSSPWNTLTYNRVAQQHLQFTGCLIKQFNEKYMYHVVRGTGQGIITSTRWFGINKPIFHMKPKPREIFWLPLELGYPGQGSASGSPRRGPRRLGGGAGRGWPFQASGWHRAGPRRP